MSLSLFYILCLTVGGEDDCSWQWSIIDDRTEFEALYDKHKTAKINSSLPQGFAVQKVKQIYVYNGAYAVNILLHEIDHAVCYLNYVEPLTCNMEIEIRDYGKLNIVRYFK
jgi:hypothetical protein